MTEEQWMKEARRWAKHAYCYEGMVDEFPEFFAALYRSNSDPYESVTCFANNHDLDRADGFYGINSHVEFKKEA